MVLVTLLIWDDFNIGHIARHGVVPGEVEGACLGAHMTAEGYDGRLRVIGPTTSGRMLTVILAPKGEGAYYPVTARPASRKERQLYEDQTKGGEAA